MKEKYSYAFEFEQRFFDIPEEENQPDFYKRLLKNNGNITKTDIKIAFYLKEHPEYLGESAREIGRNCHINGRSVSYFYKKLGYKSPFDFKLLNRIAKKV
ncbi:hypothetical protein MUO65_05845 [bacterium]|nr:hypothetical protein [bacterium]